MITSYSEQQVELLGKALQNTLIAKDAQCAALLDLAGSVIAKRDNGRVDYDIESIAVLAASNFSAVKAIAERIGEAQFSLMYHKGRKGNVHLSEVMRGFLLITIFGREISVGNLRLMVDDAVRQIRRINNHFILREKKRRAEMERRARLAAQKPKGFILNRLVDKFRKRSVPLGGERRRIG